MSDSPSVRVEKRKHEKTDYIQDKKPRASTVDAAAVNDPTFQVNDIPSLKKLLDFTALNDLSAISNQFDQVANALLHDFCLVVKCGSTETEFQILELEFYLLKSGCHEDPFTHGTEEQKVGGKWCVPQPTLIAFSNSEFLGIFIEHHDDLPILTAA
jgi:hypothetical protein